jgi:hypothetical protein
LRITRARAKHKLYDAFLRGGEPGRYGLWNSQRPTALMSDADAVQELVGHRYFQARM